MSEKTKSALEIKKWDFTKVANRRTSRSQCHIICDEESRLAFFRMADEQESRTRGYKEISRRFAEFQERFPNASIETVAKLVNKVPQPFRTLSEAPYNLLTENELARLRIRRFALSDFVFLDDGGATIVPLFWAIVAPTDELANAINPKASHQKYLLNRMVGLRDECERRRLAVIWQQRGLPPFGERAQVEDIRQCLSILERMPLQYSSMMA